MQTLIEELRATSDGDLADRVANLIDVLAEEHERLTEANRELSERVQALESTLIAFRGAAKVIDPPTP